MVSTKSRIQKYLSNSILSSQPSGLRHKRPSPSVQDTYVMLPVAGKGEKVDKASNVVVASACGTKDEVPKTRYQSLIHI